jgi:hypothetical protein
MPRMHFSITPITNNNYYTILNLRPTEVSVNQTPIVNAEGLPQQLRMFRFSVRNFFVLSVHEDTFPGIPYDFVVTLLLHQYSNRRVIAQIHFNARTPAFVIGRYDIRTNNTVYPCTLLEFPAVVNSQQSLPLQVYLSYLPSGVTYTDNSNNG